MSSITDGAPITITERVELRRNARDVARTAVWKGFACDPMHAETVGKLAQEYFDLGCWLYYYSKRLDVQDNLAERVDCAWRLFDAGISDPGDNFLIIFGFGRRHFAALFKDGNRVFEELAKR